MLNDWPLEQLQRYKPEIAAPPGLARFWQHTLEETRRHELNARFAPVDTGLTLVKTYDVSFAGYGGHTIRGWLRIPAGVEGPLPTIVEYQGYDGGRWPATRTSSRRSGCTPFNNHEGGQLDQDREKLAWLRKLFDRG